VENEILEATITLEVGILIPALPIDEDALWVERCKAGNPDAFEPLVKKFAGRIERLVRGILGDRRLEAEDAVQDVFIKAYTALPKFRGDAKFSTWLYRIAVNHCRDIIRRSPPVPVPLDENLLAAEEAPETEEAGSEEKQVRAEAESSRQLQKLLGELKESHRSILVMRELEGMSYDEIGKALGILPGTVRSRLNRARAKLLRAAENIRSEKP
jgi:RNA polymerase sigma-70 factor (ECF subfamily)